MVTLLSFMKSIHSLKVTSFLFTKKTGALQGDTLGHIYPFFNNSSSYICNSFNYGVPILYGVLYIGVAHGTKSIEKSMSLFGGNPGISLKTSRLDGLQCLPLYLWLPPPYGLQTLETPL